MGLEYSPVVDQSVIVEEESASYVKCDEDINAVVFMGSEDEEDTKTVAEPSEGVKKEDSSGGILSYEEVEESEADRVAREHVISTRPHPLEAHPCSRPDDVGLVKSGGPGAVGARFAVQMDSWN